MTDDPLVTELATIVGDAHVLTDPHTVAGYTTDWTGRFSGSTRAVVRPASTDEVARVLRACADHRADVVPQGGNTGLVGGSVPRDGEVVISLVRLNDLEPVDELAATVVVGAGVTLADLQSHARQAGLAVGVDLAARDTATVGGMVATNAGGTHVLRYGMMRSQVRGVEVVLPDGSVVTRLAGLAKDNTGYDLPGLLCGSEGTLGIITRVCLQLVPRHPHRVTALAGVDSVEVATRLTAALRTSLPSLEAVELMTREGLDLVCAHASLPWPLRERSPVALLIECAGTADPTERLAALLDEHGIADAAVGVERTDRARLWAYRERHTEAVSALGVPHKLDVALPAAALADFWAALPATIDAAAPGATIVLWGHVGDGNLHVNVLAEDGEGIEEAVLRLVARHGGSIAAEHGIGVAKTDWLPLTRSAADLAAMRAIKDALDPQRLLNPGVLLGGDTSRVT